MPTLYDKLLWDSQVVVDSPGGSALRYIDRQLVHKVRVRRRPRRASVVADPLAAAQVAELESNTAAF